MSDTKFTVVLDPTEREMLHELAKENGLSAAAWLRSTIRRKHKKLARQLEIIAAAKEPLDVG